MRQVLPLLLQQLPGDRRKKLRVHFRGEADSPGASEKFHTLHSAEWILRHRRRARVQLHHADLLLDDDRLPVEDREPLAITAGYIRQVLCNQAPVPARLAIEIHHLPAGFRDAVGTLHRGAKHAVAEEITEQERNAAAAIRAKTIDADADGRLADGL